MQFTEAERAIFGRIGKEGGKARAKALTKAQRKAIAKQGAKARWDAFYRQREKVSA